MSLTLDKVINFLKDEVDGGFNAVATAIDVVDGSKFPDPALGQYNLVWWNFTDYADPSDDPSVEIVRATAKSSNTLTVTRGQEGTTGVTHNTVGKTYKMALVLTAKMITDIASQAVSSIGGTPSIGSVIAQTGHGLSVDNVIKSKDVDGQFEKAQADVADNSEAVGIVAAVADANNFTYVSEGYVTMTTLPVGGVAGDVIWLDPTTAGGMTVTAPTSAPNVRKPLGVILDVSTKLVWFHIALGQELTGDLVGGGTKIATITSAVTITNATETAIASITIPGGTLQTNNAVRVKLFVDFVAGSNASQSVQLKLKYGGATIVTATSAALQKEENGKTYIEALLLANAGTGAQIGSISMPSNAVDSESVVIGAQGSGSVDSTADQILEVSWKFATATGSPSAKMWHGMVEQITGLGTAGGVSQKGGTDTGSSAIQNSTQDHTITHSLGAIPRMIKVRTLNTSTVGGGGICESDGNANIGVDGSITDQQCLYFGVANSGVSLVPGGEVTNAIATAAGNGGSVAGTLLTVTDSTFVIRWSATATINGTPKYVWEVFA
jgi:hypothetical protein